jgi:hypothetical protein
MNKQRFIDMNSPEVISPAVIPALLGIQSVSSRIVDMLKPDMLGNRQPYNESPHVNTGKLELAYLHVIVLVTVNGIAIHDPDIAVRLLHHHLDKERNIIIIAVGDKDKILTAATKALEHHLAVQVTVTAKAHISIEKAYPLLVVI